MGGSSSWRLSVGSSVVLSLLPQPDIKMATITHNVVFQYTASPDLHNVLSGRKLYKRIKRAVFGFKGFDCLRVQRVFSEGTNNQLLAFNKAQFLIASLSESNRLNKGLITDFILEDYGEATLSDR